MGTFIKTGDRANAVAPCAEGSRTWSDFVCSEQNNFICEGKPYVVPEPSKQTFNTMFIKRIFQILFSIADRDCPIEDGWDLNVVTGECYYLSSEPVSYLDAKQVT